MKQGIENTDAWLYYYPLLTRYARYMVKDHDTAALLVKRVLHWQYSIDGLQQKDALRQLLKADTLHSCTVYTQLEVFDCPPIKLPFA